MSKTALLALADGSLFWGESIGADGQCVGEVVFNTSITGYQEILTDPSYARQIVALTYPHIGNVGVNEEDDESAELYLSGFIMRDRSPVVSNWRSQESLESYLVRHKKVAICDIDTRRLTRILRDKGAQNGCIMAGDKVDENTALDAARSFPGLQNMDLAREVTTQSQYNWHQGSWTLGQGHQQRPEADSPFHVVAYDFGVKRNILRMLTDRGCRLTVVPAQTPAQDVLAMNPDGVFLSNGPGDPEPCDYAIASAQAIVASGVPVFGICLGHQILALACGAKTEKMKFGHHGANHPVQELSSGRVMITSQNHGFAVDEQSLPAELEPTHRSLFDGSLQGIRHKSKPAFSFQGHPEASPGPHDISELFDQFIENMKSGK